MMFDEWPHVATVQSVTHAKDASGGTVPTWATRQAAVPCLVTQASGSRADALGADLHLVSHTVTTTYAGVQRGDRLLVTTGPADLANKYLLVRGLADNGPVGDIEAFVVLSCQQVLE
jgi:hypothetical protein